MKLTEYLKAVYDSTLRSNEKLVLACMAYRKNWKSGGLAFPSIERLTRDTSLSRSSVNRALDTLRKDGWLVPTGDTKGWGVKVYDLAVGRTDTQQSPTGTATRHRDTAVVSQGHTEQEQQLDKRQVIELEEKGADAPSHPFLSKIGRTEEVEDASPGVLPEDTPDVARYLRKLRERNSEKAESEEFQTATRLIREQRPTWHTRDWWNSQTIFAIEVESGLDEAW